MSKSTATAKKVELTAEQKEAQTKVAMTAIVKDLSTWSAKIRALDAKNYTRSQIAKFLDKRYQHVRNVLITPLAPKKDTTTTT